MTLDKIKKNKEFKRIYSDGRSIANRFLVLYYLNNGLEYNRLGISISKKVGNAVIRNRIRRLITEVYRLNLPKLEPGWDFIIIARPRYISQAAYKELEGAFLNLFKKNGLLKEEVGKK